MNTTFQGTGVAIITPFNKEKQVDYQALEKLLEHIINGGVDFIVSMGTTSEAATLTEEEKEQVLSKVLRVVDNRKPVVLGIGGNNTQKVVETLKNTNFDQISGILSVAPYYNKPNQRGLYEHFSLIAKYSPRPVILYNVPGRTSSNISAETTLKLAHEFDHIVAVKEASGNFTQIMEIVKNKPDGFKVLSGDDALTLPLISIGVEGVISVVANAFPDRFSTMVRQALQGNLSKAKSIHYELIDIINQLFADGNPAGVKKALSLLNITEDYLRLPLVEVNQDVAEKLSRLIRQLK
ncbi:MAG: 4-hydroxy-tetrahydrodipicolinate synthase [Bacteroidetes bacterium]|nr:MAG: 4-hydroxy-tetrahydrodipicolinate synthase [Bacteroidota bacterium]